MLLSLILYGSRARGDHRLNSDVDLLGVVDSPSIAKSDPARGTHLHLYPYRSLRQKSLDGDLFALHLVAEGKVIHDTADVFRGLKECFRYKSSYDEEIRCGTATVLFILSHLSSLQRRNVRKRLIWALRTILIARAANDRLGIFSSKALQNHFGVDDLKTVIDKKFVVNSENLVEVARSVVESYGSESVAQDFPILPLQQISLLYELGGVCRSTADMLFAPISKFEQPVQFVSFGYEEET